VTELSWALKVSDQIKKDQIERKKKLTDKFQLNSQTATTAERKNTKGGTVLRKIQVCLPSET